MNGQHNIKFIPLVNEFDGDLLSKIIHPQHCVMKSNGPQENTVLFEQTLHLYLLCLFLLSLKLF